MGMDAIVAASLWAIVPLVAVGSLLHFVYDWSRHHRLAAIVGAVNESYWEHVKIAVWPVLLAQVVLFTLGGWRHPSFLPAATVALYSIPVTMIGLVFLYKRLVGRNVLWLDIGVFAVTIVAAQGVFVEVLQRLSAGPLLIVIAAFYFAGVVAAFLAFTVRPPTEPDVFIDPITGRYGVRGHPTPDT